MVIIALASALCAPLASAVGPGIEPVSQACATEDFLTGTHEACDEARSPTRLPAFAGCYFLWVVGEHEGEDEYACGAILDVEIEWGTYYVTPLPYAETNGCPGYQSEAGDCDADGSPEAPDEGILGCSRIDECLA